VIESKENKKEPAFVMEPGEEKRPYVRRFPELSSGGEIISFYTKDKKMEPFELKVENVSGRNFKTISQGQAVIILKKFTRENQVTPLT
jgi:hypothetical protein